MGGNNITSRSVVALATETYANHRRLSFKVICDVCAGLLQL